MVTRAGPCPKNGSSMGYYTSYGLSLYGPTDECEAFEKDLLDLSDNDEEVRELLKYGGCYAKLYDLEAWMDQVAKKHPSVLAILSGDGEESDDQWEHRWKGLEDEVQKAIIPPFKNERLFTEYEKKQLNQSNQ